MGFIGTLLYSYFVIVVDHVLWINVVLSLRLLTPPGHRAPSLVQQVVHIPSELSASPQGSAASGFLFHAAGGL